MPPTQPPSTARSTARTVPSSSPGPHRASRHLAAQDRPPYDTVSAASDPEVTTTTDPTAGPTDPDHAEMLEGTLAALTGTVNMLAGIDLDAATDTQLEMVTQGVQVQLDRLTTCRNLAAGQLRGRAVHRAGPGRETRAAQTAQARLADQL